MSDTECGGVYINLTPGAPPYPQGIGLQFNFTLVEPQLAAGASVSCRVLLTSLATHLDYALKLATINIYWDKHGAAPFNIKVADAVTGAEITTNLGPRFFVSYVGTADEISTASDWVVTITNTSNKKQSMSAAGMIVGDHR